MSHHDPIALRLRRLDVCCVSDALDQLRLPSAVSGLLPRTVPQRIAGPVTTVRLKEGPPLEGGKPRHLCTAAIEAAPAGGIVVVEQRTGVDAAGWGGMLSTAAAFRKLSGVIVDGPARDIDEAATLGFPVYSRSQTARTARGRVHEAETGGEIEVGGVAVRTGDWAIADSSGIAFIRMSDIAAVLDAAERLFNREALMTKDILAGQPVSQVMGATYEHMLDNRSEETLS
jgi:Demethylmenaquinone methyltransferase